MNFLSICSGVEAASVAWEAIGWTPIGFSEIDEFPSAVLKHHYQDVPNYGGMTLRDYFAAKVIGSAFLDLFTGWRQRGEPVQEDWPMGLAIDAYRVADAMLEARENKS